MRQKFPSSVLIWKATRVASQIPRVRDRDETAPAFGMQASEIRQAADKKGALWLKWWFDMNNLEKKILLGPGDGLKTKLFNWWKKLKIKSALGHVGLLVTLMAYTAAGGLVHYNKKILYDWCDSCDKLYRRSKLWSYFNFFLFFLLFGK